MLIAYKKRFIVLLDMLLIGIKACDLVTHKFKTSDCNFKTIRTKRLIYPYLIFGVSVIFQTHFVVVDFLGGLAFVDLQDSATSKSENTSLWLL